MLGTANFASGANFGIQVVAPESVSYGGPGNSISGSIGFMMLGSGTLALGGANSYSGSTTISSGVLVVGSNVTAGVAGPLGDSTANIGLGDANSGASAVELAVSGGYAIGRNVLVAANTNSSALATLASVSNNTATYGGTITLWRSAEHRLRGDGRQQLDLLGSPYQPKRALSGVTVTGGSVSFTGTESYTGGTTVSGGSLSVGVGTWLPATTLTQSGSSLVTLQNSGTQSLVALAAVARDRAEFEEQFGACRGQRKLRRFDQRQRGHADEDRQWHLDARRLEFLHGPHDADCGHSQGGGGQRLSPASAMVINGGTLDATAVAKRLADSRSAVRVAESCRRRRLEKHRRGQSGRHAEPLRQSHQRDHGIDELCGSHRNLRQP